MVATSSYNVTVKTNDIEIHTRTLNSFGSRSNYPKKTPITFPKSFFLPKKKKKKISDNVMKSLNFMLKLIYICKNEKCIYYINIIFG
jgi:hypothetical protein